VRIIWEFTAFMAAMMAIGVLTFWSLETIVAPATEPEPIGGHCECTTIECQVCPDPDTTRDLEYCEEIGYKYAWNGKESWKDKQSGEKKEVTEWHRVVMFRRLAEIAAEYLKKGSQVYIEGKLKTRKWQDKDGNDRYTTEIEAREMQMLDSRQSSSPAQQSAPAASSSANTAPPEDDIPF